MTTIRLCLMTTVRGALRLYHCSPRPEAGLPHGDASPSALNVSEPSQLFILHHGKPALAAETFARRWKLNVCSGCWTGAHPHACLNLIAAQGWGRGGGDRPRRQLHGQPRGGGCVRHGGAAGRLPRPRRLLPGHPQRGTPRAPALASIAACQTGLISRAYGNKCPVDDVASFSGFAWCLMVFDGERSVADIKAVLS